MFQTRLKANFAFNVIGMGLPFGVALVTIPLYVAHIGAARYGILSIVWILLGYFGFIDLGLSRACTNALAKRAHASQDERASVLMTALQLNLLLGCVGALAFYLAGGFLLRHLLTLTDALSFEADAALPWIAGLLPATMLTAMGRGAIESRDRFLAVNVLDTVGAVLGQTVPLIAAVLIAPSLPVVMAATFAARALSAGLTLAYVARHERLTPAVGMNRSHVRDLLGFGAWVSVDGVITPFLIFLDQLSVGTMLGAVAVAHYVVPMNLVFRTQIVSSALSRAVFPRLSLLNREHALALAEKSVVSLGYGYGALCAAGILIAAPFMTLWMKADFASFATPVLQIALFGAWINGIASIPVALLQGQGRPDLVTKLHVVEFIPYVLLLWVLLAHFGLVGAALAWTGRVTIDALVLFRLAGFRIGHSARLVPAVALLAISYFVTQTVPTPPLASASCAAVVFVAFTACGLALDPHMRRLALSLYDRLARPGLARPSH